MQRVRVYILITGLATFSIMYLTADFTNAFNFLRVSILQLHCLKLNSLCSVFALRLFRMLIFHDNGVCT